MTQRTSSSGNPFGNIGAVIGLVLFFGLLYFLLSGLFWLLSWVAPVLLLITAVIDFKVITDFGKWTLNLFSKNWMYALITVGILVILPYLGFSFLSNAIFSTIAGLLFGKALLKRKVNEVREQFNGGIGTSQEAEGEYTEYEEVDTEINNPTTTTSESDIEILELDPEPLPKAKPIKETRDGNTNYDQFFE